MTFNAFFCVGRIFSPANFQIVTAVLDSHLCFFLAILLKLMIPLFFKLLGITIQHEKPQLEVQKTELLRKEEELKVQLAELEESLLEVETTKIYKTYLSNNICDYFRERLL